MSGDLNAHDISGLGQRVRRSYENESLNSTQRERHLRRVADAQRNLGTTGPGLRLHRAELVMIAAVAVLALIGVFGWQALRPSGNEEAESGSSTPSAEVREVGSSDEAGFYGGMCNITPYSNERPPDASQAVFTETWFGEDRLWAGLGRENEGVWSANELRVLWWRQAPVPLKVTGTRLDADAPALEADIFAGYDGYSHQITTLQFPEPGCWEVIGQAGDQELRFVVDVQPVEEGPADQAIQEQKDAIEQERQNLMPHPVPETCNVSVWQGPELRLRGMLPPDGALQSYWLDGEGMSMGMTHGVLFEGDNDLTWLVNPGLSDIEALGGDITVEGVHEDGWLMPLDLTVSEQIPPDWIRDDDAERAWRSTLSVPKPGCWDIIATAGPHTLEATVYVYPQQ